MGFSSCYIPKLNELVQYYDKHGLKGLYKRYKSYDRLVGDVDAMDYLLSKIKEYEAYIGNEI
jgi:hypothetical protein